MQNMNFIDTDSANKWCYNAMYQRLNRVRIFDPSPDPTRPKSLTRKPASISALYQTTPTNFIVVTVVN